MKITTDSFNPVLIKELRQYFHGKLFLITMCLLLLAQLGALFIVYATLSQHHGSHDEIGIFFFSSVMVMYALASAILCGLIVIARFTQERSNPELDFTRFCAMSPLQILWGKMTSSLAIAIYLLSLCLPFFVIAYFLRGISIFVILTTVGYAIIGTLFIIQVSLFIGSIGQKVLAGVLAFGSIWGGLGMIGFLIAALGQFYRYSTSDDDYIITSLIVFFCLLLLGFIFVLNLALLSAPYANRTLPARIYIIVIALLSPLVAFGFKLANKSVPLLEIMVPTVIIFLILASCLSSFIAAFERSVIGPRVQKQCPQSPLKRFGFFLISSGSGGGLTLAWILQLIAFAIAIVTPLLTSSNNRIFNHWVTDTFILLSFGFASLFYTQIGLCIHKRFKIMPILAWLIVTVITVFLPLLFYSFLTFTFDNGDGFKVMLITTPFFLPAMDDNTATLKDLTIWILPFLSFVTFGFAFPHIREQFDSLRKSSDS